jgi:hypothetical protein
LPRSRKRRGAAAAPVAPRGDDGAQPTTDTPDDRMARGYARGRERDAAARASLQPLAPGERPLAIRLSVALAAVIAIANVVLLIAGYGVDGQRPSVAGALIFAGLMTAAAIGMWQLRYWAVLGFEALLGIALVFAAISLMVASNLAAALLCLGIIVVTAPLFWTLIRVMARIQLPARRERERVG